MWSVAPTQVETIQKTLTDLVESGDPIERVTKSWKEAIPGRVQAEIVRKGYSTGPYIPVQCINGFLYEFTLGWGCMGAGPEGTQGIRLGPGSKPWAISMDPCACRYHVRIIAQTVPPPNKEQTRKGPNERPHTLRPFNAYLIPIQNLFNNDPKLTFWAVLSTKKQNP